MPVGETVAVPGVGALLLLASTATAATAAPPASPIQSHSGTAATATAGWAGHNLASAVRHGSGASQRHMHVLRLAGHDADHPRIFQVAALDDADPMLAGRNRRQLHGRGADGSTVHEDRCGGWFG